VSRSPRLVPCWWYSTTMCKSVGNNVERALWENDLCRPRCGWYEDGDIWFLSPEHFLRSAPTTSAPATTYLDCHSTVTVNEACPRPPPTDLPRPIIFDWSGSLHSTCRLLSSKRPFLSFFPLDLEQALNASHRSLLKHRHCIETSWGTTLHSHSASSGSPPLILTEADHR
jgi:hypothetical protein